jgi:hypothetical protein
MIEEKVKQLMDLMGTTKNIEKGLEDTMEQVKKFLPPVDEFRQIWDRFAKDIVTKTIMNFMKESIAPLWGEHYSEEELDALIAFYSSPVGGKIMGTQQEMGKRMTQMMFSMSQKIAKEFETKMKEEGF